MKLLATGVAIAAVATAAHTLDVHPFEEPAVTGETAFLETFSAGLSALDRIRRPEVQRCVLPRDRARASPRPPRTSPARPPYLPGTFPPRRLAVRSPALPDRASRPRPDDDRSRPASSLPPGVPTVVVADKTEDKGLYVDSPARHYGVSSLSQKPFDPSEGLVLQYEVTLQDGLDCGGAYLKFLTAEPTSPRILVTLLPRHVRPR